MTIGNKDRRVEIQYKVITQDPAYGTEVVTWTSLVTVWANVEDVPPSRSEAVKTGLAVAINQSKVTIRYRAGIDSSMRLVISRPDPVVYQIIGGPAMIGRYRELEMVCEKISS
jgi:SPP1 family predicted phage head-tail adaptor